MNNNNHEQITETHVPAGIALPSQTSEALAIRLESGTTNVAALASRLSDAVWQTRLSRDCRKIGVLLHDVASMYPLEIQLAGLLAAVRPVARATWGAVETINRDHAKQNDNVTRPSATVTAISLGSKRHCGLAPRSRCVDL